jgi:gliding motility-associated lipoprotein GldH
MNRLSFRAIDLALTIALGLLLAGCGGERLEEKWSLPEGSWRLNDSLEATFEAKAGYLPQQLTLGLTLTDAYPYRNLYVQFRVRTPKGREYTTLPQLLLADSLGTWRAKRSWWGTYRFETVLNNAADFPEPGTYHFSLKHYMRQDTLPGVTAVRFSVMPTPARQPAP